MICTFGASEPKTGCLSSRATPPIMHDVGRVNGRAITLIAGANPAKVPLAFARVTPAMHDAVHEPKRREQSQPSTDVSAQLDDDG